MQKKRAGKANVLRSKVGVRKKEKKIASYHLLRTAG